MNSKRQAWFLIVLSIIAVFSMAMVSSSAAAEYPMKSDAAMIEILPGFVPTEYHVVHYELDLRVHFDGDSLSGNCMLAVMSDTTSLTEVKLDLRAPMSVQNVSQGGSPLLFTFADNVITIELAASVPKDNQVTLDIAYSGRPSQATGHGCLFGEHNGVPIVSTFGELWGLAYWCPCVVAIEGHKPTFGGTFTVPDTMFAVSNGELVSVTDNGDGTKTFVWDSVYPIPTYGIAMAVTNYIAYCDTLITNSGDTLTFVNYLYPEDPPSLNDLWSIQGTVDTLENHLGPQPFHGYPTGQVRYQQGGAMEHQNITFLPDICTGGCSDLRDHEAAHARFGNAVTCSTYNHVWWQEGMATYTEALLHGWRDGEAAYHDYMALLNNRDSFVGTLYVPNPTGLGNTITITQYNKGAQFWHMLRKIMGDEAFFAFVREINVRFAYGSVSTEDLQSLAEEYYGGILEWLFQRWVYGPGRPHYLWHYQTQSPANGQVSVIVDQIQTSDLFTMPIDFDVVTDQGTQRFTVWDSLAHQVFTLPVSGIVQDVVLDPEDWVLNLETKETPTTVATGETDASMPTSRIALKVFPQPVKTTTNASFSLPQGESFELNVYDATGRFVASVIQGVGIVGTQTLEWSGRSAAGAQVASGVYFMRLTTATTSVTRKVTVMRSEER